MKSRCKNSRNSSDQSGTDCDGLFALFCLGFSQLYNYFISADKQELELGGFFLVN